MKTVGERPGVPQRNASVVGWVVLVPMEPTGPLESSQGLWAGSRQEFASALAKGVSRNEKHPAIYRRDADTTGYRRTRYHPYWATPQNLVSQVGISVCLHVAIKATLTISFTFDSIVPRIMPHVICRSLTIGSTASTIRGV